MTQQQPPDSQSHIPLPPLRSRLLGTLYGLAVGDALGGPYEFQNRGAYFPSTDMEESHTFFWKGKPLPRGTWTDDTSMALCVAKSLLDHERMNVDDVTLNMVRWYKEGYLSAIDTCFDIGITTATALKSYYTQLTRDYPNSLPRALPPSFAFTPHLNTSARLSGNGSLMRLSPVPAFFHSSFEDAINATDAQGKITHASEHCVEACRYACVVLLGLFEEGGEAETETCEARKRRVLGAEFVPRGVSSTDPRLQFSTPEMVAIRSGAYKEKPVEEISTSGFVIHSLEAALWAFWNSSSYEEGMLLLLPLGEDVDTVCAIYGQFAGALYGVEAIPARWLGALQRRDLVDGIFGGLVEKAVGR